MGWLMIWGLGSCTCASDSEWPQVEEEVAPPKYTGDTNDPTRLGKFEFLEAHTQVLCELWERCDLIESHGYADAEECAETSTTEFERGGCDGYDADAALACIDAFQRMTCEELHDGPTPEVCHEVCD